jgi:hypothetical protein
MTELLATASPAVSLTKHAAFVMNDELSITVAWTSGNPVSVLHLMVGSEDKAISVDEALNRRKGDGFEGGGRFSARVDLTGLDKFLPYTITLEDSQGVVSDKVSGRVRIKPAASRSRGVGDPAVADAVPSLGLVKVNLPGGNLVSFSSIATDDKGLYEISFKVFDLSGKEVKQQVLQTLGKHWQGSTEPFSLGNGAYRVVARAVDSSGNSSVEQTSKFDVYDVPILNRNQSQRSLRPSDADAAAQAATVTAPAPADRVFLKLTPEALAKLNLGGDEAHAQASYQLEVSCASGCSDLQAQAEDMARQLGATVMTPEEAAAGAAGERSIAADQPGEQITVRKRSLNRGVAAEGDSPDVLTINIKCGGWCLAIKKVGEAIFAVFDALSRSAQGAALTSGGAGAAVTSEIPAGESRSLSKKLTEGKFYALMIGINNYQHINKLQNAVNDATVMDQVLRENYGFESVLLLDDQANRDNIMKSLNDLRKKLTENDSLVIFYSGHGEFNKQTETSYWLPVDAGIDDNTKWLESRSISDQLKLISAKHVLVIADSCFSGTMTRAANAELTSNLTREKYLNKLSEKTSRVLIASGGNEPVTDAGGKGHSIFSDVLIAALKQPFDTVFTAEELMTRQLKESVAGRTEQTPEYKVVRNSGHDGGDFIFVKIK